MWVAAKVIKQVCTRKSPRKPKKEYQLHLRVLRRRCIPRPIPGSQIRKATGLGWGKGDVKQGQSYGETKGTCKIREFKRVKGM